MLLLLLLVVVGFFFAGRKASTRFVTVATMYIAASASAASDVRGRESDPC